MKSKTPSWHLTLCRHTHAITVRDEMVYVYSHNENVRIFMQVRNQRKLSMQHGRNKLERVSTSNYHKYSYAN